MVKEVKSTTTRRTEPPLTEVAMTDRKLLVLLVEDDKNVAKAMIRWLKSKGCEVSHLVGDVSAYWTLDRDAFQFDAVITDWDLGAGETGQAIVSAAQARKIPVRVFSGSPCPSDELASIWLGKTDLDGLKAFLDEVRRG